MTRQRSKLHSGSYATEVLSDHEGDFDCDEAYESPIVTKVRNPHSLDEFVLYEIMSFAACKGLDAHGALRAWRTLSRPDKELSDRTAKLPSIADHVCLRFISTPSAYRKLDFYIQALNVPVKKLTITDGNTNCSDFTNSLADHMVLCPNLESVSFYRCSGLEDGAVAHLTQCPHLQHVHFGGCCNLTDETAEHLARCTQLRSLKFEGCAGLQDRVSELRRRMNY